MIRLKAGSRETDRKQCQKVTLVVSKDPGGDANTP